MKNTKTTYFSLFIFYILKNFYYFCFIIRIPYPTSYYLSPSIRHPAFHTLPPEPQVASKLSNGVYP